MFVLVYYDFPNRFNLICFQLRVVDTITRSLFGIDSIVFLVWAGWLVGWLAGWFAGPQCVGGWWGGGRAIVPPNLYWLPPREGRGGAWGCSFPAPPFEGGGEERGWGRRWRPPPPRRPAEVWIPSPTLPPFSSPPASPPPHRNHKLHHPRLQHPVSSPSSRPPPSFPSSHPHPCALRASIPYFPPSHSSSSTLPDRQAPHAPPPG